MEGVIDVAHVEPGMAGRDLGCAPPEALVLADALLLLGREILESRADRMTRMRVRWRVRRSLRLPASPPPCDP